MKTIPRYLTDLVEDLETQYPPRCLEPRESVEDHHRYAGKVELVQELRNRLLQDEA